MNERKYDLEERLLNYAAAVIAITESFPRSPAGLHVGGQLLRSGTSPLSNHGEAQGAESPDDFIHKLRIGLKELRESKRWLKLARRTTMARSLEEADSLIAETDELTAIFVCSIRTAEKRRK
jgi:four helix bundle protein